MKNSHKKLSIVIVNFNAGDYLIKCLSSLKKLKTEIGFDVWVVDNASEDQSIQQARKLFPQINYILNNQNLGFGRANNLALRQIKTEFVLLLNPDTEVFPDTLNNLLDFMEQNPKVGVV